MNDNVKKIRDVLELHRDWEDYQGMTRTDESFVDALAALDRLEAECAAMRGRLEQIADANEKEANSGDWTVTPEVKKNLLDYVEGLRQITSGTAGQQLLADHAAALAKKDAQISLLKEWEDAVTDAGVVHWTLSAENAYNPRKAIDDLIRCVIQETLDPAISEPVAKLHKELADYKKAASAEARLVDEAVAELARLRPVVEAVRNTGPCWCPKPAGSCYMHPRCRAITNALRDVDAYSGGKGEG